MRQSAGEITLVLLLLAVAARPSRAGEVPFLMTYTHQMEEPGNLEIAIRSVAGKPDGGNGFVGVGTEFEYSLTHWWTSEAYLDGQSTGNEDVLFTGFRFENRFRPLRREHWINPVLYLEYESITSADKTLLEVVGRDGERDLVAPNSLAQRERDREIEAKIILGSSLRGWTIAENFIAEKNVSRGPFEFGYSVGASRPLALAARSGCRNSCANNIQLGVEMYGGLGTHDEFGLRGTSHYMAPVLAWTLGNGTTFYVSPGFGLTNTSVPFLPRFGVSYGVDGFGHAVRSVFRGHAAPGGARS